MSTRSPRVVFVLRITPMRGVDPVRALRLLLKIYVAPIRLALRDVREEHACVKARSSSWTNGRPGQTPRPARDGRLVAPEECR